MTPSQHARNIFSEIKVEGILKYMRGQREHGGQLWKIPIPTMVAFAKEEVIDQVSYVKTLESQVSLLKDTFLSLCESLEEGEEPLSVAQLVMINQIRELLGVE